jgi:hypothetical protein
MVARPQHLGTIRAECGDYHAPPGRSDLGTLAEAGITPGSWYAWPSTQVGYELIAAGMLIMAGGGNGTPLDYDVLERWPQVVMSGDEITQGRAVSGRYATT